MVMNLGIFVLWFILFEGVYVVNCQCVMWCRFDVWRLLIMQLESLHEYGNYVSCVLARTGHCHWTLSFLPPDLSVDSVHSKAHISFLPACTCVCASFCCLPITVFLQLLLSDGALFLGLCVLLHLFIIILLLHC
jgi:hypothetical protein